MLAQSTVSTCARWCHSCFAIALTLQAWNGSTSTAPDVGSLASCLEAARGRCLPPATERELVMLHTIQPHWDPAKHGKCLSSNNMAPISIEK